MTKAVPPKTDDQAIELLDRFKTLAGQLEAIEAGRSEALASTNAVADALAVPVIEEQNLIIERIRPWWTKAGPRLTGGKRKSIEFGGCMIGTRMSRAVLEFANGDSDAALAALQGQRWAKPYVRVTYSVDRTATLKGLDSTHGKKLKELGFVRKPGEDEFFLQRVAQAGTVSSTNG